MTGALLAALVVAALPAPPAAPPGTAPLPYVQGGSRWVYRSNLGAAHVRLDREPGPGGGALGYRWEIRMAGGGMREALELRADGLFTAERSFFFLGMELWRVVFDPPELTIPLPLEVGRRWKARTRVASGASWAWNEVEGAVEALEQVDVPAGRFCAHRIRLLRTDTWGTRMDSVIWLDPLNGVVKAEGELRWPGVVGAVQRLLGLSRLRVELVRASVVRPAGPAVGAGGSCTGAPDRGAELLHEGRG